MAPRSKLLVYHPVHGYPILPQQDLKTIKRNARERNRVETVNRSFETLRQVVPSAAAYKKLSKVNIIHHALEYIHQLMYMVQACDTAPLHSSVSLASPATTAVMAPAAASPRGTPIKTASTSLLWQQQASPAYSTDSGVSGDFTSSVLGVETSKDDVMSGLRHHDIMPQLPQLSQLSRSHDVMEQVGGSADFFLPDLADFGGDNDDDVLDAIVQWQSV